ncbi:MAG TPA: SIMPL domain-containing protein [Acidothermaceae bacterium]
MADPIGLLLSVRGEARVVVAPDSVVLSCALTVSRTSKAEAMAGAAAASRRLTADLASLGGVSLGVDTEQAALTWSARSATSWEESQHNKLTGLDEPSERVNATVELQVTTRTFDILDALGAHLGTHKELHVRQVNWRVNSDNPAWAQVRAAAIHAAIATGRDYATALGVSLLEVAHVADAGLLDGEMSLTGGNRPRGAMMSAGGGSSLADTPSLDPEPQELTATIDARLRATAVTLTGS